MALDGDDEEDELDEDADSSEGDESDELGDDGDENGHLDDEDADEDGDDDEYIKRLARESARMRVRLCCCTTVPQDAQIMLFVCLPELKLCSLTTLPGHWCVTW